MSKQILIIDENFDRDCELRTQNNTSIIPHKILDLEISSHEYMLYCYLKACSCPHMKDEEISLDDVISKMQMSKKEFFNALENMSTVKIGGNRTLIETKENDDYVLEITLKYTHDVMGGFNE